MLIPPKAGALRAPARPWRAIASINLRIRQRRCAFQSRYPNVGTVVRGEEVGWRGAAPPLDPRASCAQKHTAALVQHLTKWTRTNTMF